MLRHAPPPVRTTVCSTAISTTTPELVGDRIFRRKDQPVKRVTILGTLVAIGSLSIAVMAAQPPQKKAPPEPHADNISVEKVKDNLFVLRGGGGNTAAFVTAKGVTLVDTKNP